MIQYQALARHVLQNGQDRGDRTGTGTRGVFGYQMRFDLTKGFPLVTSKFTFFRGVAEELFWMLRGSVDVRELQRVGVHIWDEWATEGGSLGPVYGHQWRTWSTIDGKSVVDIDQIQALIDGLRNKPYSRRHIVSAWNVADLPDEGLSPQENVEAGNMALAPCHCLFQFYVDKSEDGVPRLSCQLYQRSADVFLGLPFNIASYALLLHLVAHHLHLQPGEFIWTGGDVHIYHTHFDAALEMLERRPKPSPYLHILRAPELPLEEVEWAHIALDGYDHHPAIKAPVAV